MPFVEHDHMIEQITAAAFHPALSDSVLPRTSERRELGPASYCSDGSNHFKTELLVAIKNQVFVRGLVRKRFKQLLHDPAACRVSRDVEMKNAPAIMANQEEAVEESEGDGVDCEKVHRRDDFAVVLEKCVPPSDLVGVPRGPLYPTRDGTFRDIKAEHLQFPMNARRSPRGVLRHHAEDQFAQLLADAFSSGGNRMVGEPRPVESKTSTVPAGNGL